MQIKLKRNNDRALNITVKRENEAVDITGWTIKLTVKPTQNATDGAAIISKTVSSHTDAANGLTTISIDATDTAAVTPGNYYYDILIVDDASKRQNSSTGLFIIEQEVTDGA